MMYTQTQPCPCGPSILMGKGSECYFKFHLQRIYFKGKPSILCLLDDFRVNLKEDWMEILDQHINTM